MADKDAIYDQVAGKVKETAGRVTGDKEAQTEGRLQNIEGTVAETLDEVKDEVVE
ncbi:MAG: CsbD family protein [Actinomyces dentalis]